MSSKTEQMERLKEIIKISDKLKWIYPTNSSKISVSYPLMRLSEVEKCMLAMADDFELQRMRKWYEEELQKEGTKKKYVKNLSDGTYSPLSEDMQTIICGLVLINLPNDGECVGQFNGD